MLKTEEVKDIENCWDSRTYRKRLFCGNVYIIIAFKNEDKSKVEFVRIASPKNDVCGGSFYEAIADQLTFSIKRIRNKYEAEAVVKNLMGHRCNRYIPNENQIKSCSDAIGRVLKEVLLKESEDKCVKEIEK